MAKYLQGKFKPRNPQKYKGDPTNIIYRSSWELKFLMVCDSNPAVLEYSSEEIVVPYRSPKDNKIHRYFPDFVLKTRTPQGIETVMIEIKPYAQTLQPVKKSRITKAFINEVMTYAVNQSKWEAAEIFCASRKWKFQVMTEKDLGILT